MNTILGNLKTQLALTEKQLAVERLLLARVPQLVADVQANHAHTIGMRIAHYEKHIADLQTKIAGA